MDKNLIFLYIHFQVTAILLQFFQHLHLPALMKHFGESLLAFTSRNQRI